jgi:hypothetical protein
MTHSLGFTINQALFSHYNHHVSVTISSHKNLSCLTSMGKFNAGTDMEIQQSIFCRGSVQD